MKVAVLAPIAWRTPPRHYGPWERFCSLLTEELVCLGLDVTLFATGDSVTKAKLEWVCPRGYEEDKSMDAKVWESIHISNCFEKASGFDLIHNNFDFLPLTYSNLVKTPVLTTIHGFSSDKILRVYEKYDRTNYYVSISDSDRSPLLHYEKTIHHGIDLENFTFREKPGGDYLLYFGRFHRDKGAREAIEISKTTGKKLLMAGIVQDRNYFDEFVRPFIAEGKIEFLGSVGPEQRDKLLGNALALLHPINFDEPFGFSVVEAMACGTPVIAFNRGSMPEIIEDGRTGFLVCNTKEASDSVFRLGSIKRVECRKAAEKRFSRRKMAVEYVDVYKRIFLKGKTDEKTDNQKI
ncbi:glycosyltransferase family 4 protein [candidate division WOR-3 bacterium]|nr:glycosyltransferase family 4 protein [candidate division WOR-3 bacterium]